MTDAAPPAPPASLPELSGADGRRGRAASTPSSARSTCSSPRPGPRPRRHETRRAAAAEKLTAATRRRAVGRRPGPDRGRGPQRPARPADQAGRPHGVPGRRPRGQAPGARPLPRRARRPTPTTLGRVRRRAGRARRGRQGGAARLARPEPASPPAVSRLLLGAQEDLRREIARAMHDGPAQSLTNIVLQAQIVERLVRPGPGHGRRRGPPARRDGPADPRGDQVVHLRRPADGPRRPRARARPCAGRPASAAGAPASRSTSIRSAPDRRLPMDLESGLFRIVDEALAGLPRARARSGSRSVSTGPTRSRRRVSASRAAAEVQADATPERRPRTSDLPPALAAMMEDRRADARDAVEAARREAIVVLPPSTWREIQGRAVDARDRRRAVGRRRGAPAGRRAPRRWPPIAAGG